MSYATSPKNSDDADDDPWERLAEHRDTLEMMVEEEVAFAGRAQKLLDRLEEEGH